MQLSRDSLESEHLVDVCVAGLSGAEKHWGEYQRAAIPRSSIKPIQVLPLLRSGAAEAFALSDTEIALGAASHSGEAQHVDAVDGWLRRIGLDRSALECGIDRPISVDEADRLQRAGQSFEAIHNCCSGKHTGFLTIARHLGIDHVGYIDREHPVQQLVTDAIAEFTGVPVHDLTSGRDGCGIPTFALPLDRLALSMARLVTSADSAAKRVTSALAANPFWISGTDRCEVRLVGAASEPLVMKAGAEGVYMAGLPERGLGVALKVRDGAGRAGEAAIAAVLAELGVVPESASVSDITNKAGTVVGAMQVHRP